MDEWIKLTEYNWAFWIAGLFALLDFTRYAIGIATKFHEWLFTKKGVETKKMREKREWNERLVNAESAIVEIKDTSKQNVDMFINHERQVVEKFVNIRDEIVNELNRLHDKIDEQKAEMDKTNEANTKTDCAMLRDRIASGMRYFSQNKDADGNVHIAFSDYENMEALFQEYFSKGGNGAFKKMYKTEFQTFIINR